MSESSPEEDTPEAEVRQQLLALLLEKVHADRYPSATMLDLIEDLVRPEEKPVYARVLMAKVRADRFPSLDLMKRVQDLC